MPVPVANKSKKAGKEVVEKAPTLEEESAKKVDAFQSEMLDRLTLMETVDAGLSYYNTVSHQSYIEILGSPQKQRFKKKACQMVRTHVKLVVEEDKGSLGCQNSAGRRLPWVPRSGPD